MSQILRTQARIERSSGITADAVVNTFHNMVPTDGNAAAVTAAGVIAGHLTTFYNAIDVYLANSLSPSVTFKTYTLADPPPRAPVVTTVSPLTLGSTALPAELALCLSYRALPESGVPVGRTRGRIYLGPLVSSILGTALNGDIRPGTLTVTNIVAAGAALANNLEASYPWCVWSPTSLTARPVYEVSVDNAFDIQRRRGARPTTRERTVTG